MTEKKLKEILDKNLLGNPNSMIDTETGLKAVFKIAKTAKNKGIDWALVGGVAMYIYGSPRLTKDADVIASAVLSELKPERPLGFGGNRYLVKVGKKEVPIDWIVRNDEAKILYQAALKEAVLISEIPIVTPEWIILMKYLAGRFKDQEDAVFLLRQKDLVNRKLIREHIRRVLGANAWLGYSIGLQRWYDIADGVITTEKEDYDPKARIE